LASGGTQSAEQGGSFLPTYIWKNIQRKDFFNTPWGYVKNRVSRKEPYLSFFCERLALWCHITTYTFNFDKPSSVHSFCSNLSAA